jgi:hypothetical protein
MAKWIHPWTPYWSHDMKSPSMPIIYEEHYELSADKWEVLDIAFATDFDPLTEKFPPGKDRYGLFSRITEHPPAPIGLTD